MWTLLIIISAIASADAVKLSETKVEEAIEALFLGVTDITLHDRIRLMCEMHAIGLAYAEMSNMLKFGCKQPV